MPSMEENKELQVREALSGTGCPFAYGNFWKCPIKSSEDDPKNVKLDKRGVPLSPQPNQHKDDPLVSQVLFSSERYMLMRLELAGDMQALHRAPDQLPRHAWPYERSSHKPHSRPACAAI
jgi:hypothetical protein